ncbi:O-methyltransferase [Kribbella sp. NPDC056345]|uniref:O-methyltransferase n=1 Tax=Kribbella sp. NPDC056345 TaxID=3345789 RepID=UPI0035DEB336
MSVAGTQSYAGADVPNLVAAAVELAVELGFSSSCRVEQGQLLMALAAGASGVIGETGTGCGVGLAWLVSGRRPGARIVSIERDAERAERVRQLFHGVDDVEIVTGDWSAIVEHAPFDLLVLDGGGSLTDGSDVDPSLLLHPGGTVVNDDFTPITQWPPVHAGAVDAERLAWLTHPGLLAAELRLAPDLSTIVATRRP